MIAIFIFSIISMFAVPTYKNYLIKASRIEAKSALLDLANRLENHFYIYNTYVNATIGTNKISDVLSSPETINKHYTLNIIAASKYTYTIQASLINKYFDKDCVFFTLSNTGIQDASNKDLCW